MGSFCNKEGLLFTSFGFIVLLIYTTIPLLQNTYLVGGEINFTNCCNNSILISESESELTEGEDFITERNKAIEKSRKNIDIELSLQSLLISLPTKDVFHNNGMFISMKSIIKPKEVKSKPSLLQKLPIVFSVMKMKKHMHW